MTSPDTGLGAGITSFPGIARIASRGNRMATLISAFAFAFSGVSFYENGVEAAEAGGLRSCRNVLCPRQRRRHRAVRDPLDVLNDGARTGTVLAMELDVTDMDGQVEALL